MSYPYVPASILWSDECPLLWCEEIRCAHRFVAEEMAARALQGLEGFVTPPTSPQREPLVPPPAPMKTPFPDCRYDDWTNELVFRQALDTMRTMKRQQQQARFRGFVFDSEGVPIAALGRMAPRELHVTLGNIGGGIPIVMPMPRGASLRSKRRPAKLKDYIY